MSRTVLLVRLALRGDRRAVAQTLNRMDPADARESVAELASALSLIAYQATRRLDGPPEA